MNYDHIRLEAIEIILKIHVKNYILSCHITTLYKSNENEPIENLLIS